MTVCPQCGTTIPPDASPGGLCPQCLLKLGLLEDMGETAAPPDSEPSSGTSDNGQAPVGEQFGPYTTIRILGEGGMGIVYLAEQHKPIRRQVALKVIKLGMNTREVIARFESERQALALMDHPNIARVFDAGASVQGQPYFVMEYVAGIPITEYCDKYRLSNRERMELFLQVCQAVQHAHQKGVIHRDIKPSNVLVGQRDGQPFPQVIDFGIAKATDQRLAEYTAFTQFGQLVGTPEYMSPEQAEVGGRNVDTTTDVYSLGVLLYQLLVGALPFEGTRLREAGLVELLRIIREEDPPTPANRLAGLKDAALAAANRHTDPPAMRRQLAGDLSWIVLKAIEKDKDRRYPSASDFAGDVRRYLTDQPVVARPPSKSYHLQKFTQRHRGLVTSLAALFLALVAGAVVSTWEAVRARRAEAVALQARGRATYLFSLLNQPIPKLLSFEGQISPGFPLGWRGGPPGTIFADNQVVHGGRWSARFERVEHRHGEFSDLLLELPITFAGREVELRGFLRTEKVTGFAGLWMRENDDNGQELAFDNMAARRVHGTTDWAEYRITLPLKSNAENLFVGALMSESGRTWVDDLALSIDGHPIFTDSHADPNGTAASNKPTPALSSSPDTAKRASGPRRK